MGDLKVSVTIPTDEKGMMGRECLECEQYFKLKPGTGLPTDHCHCPYCDYEGKSDTFWTKSQIEYARSIALKQGYEQIVRPMLDNFYDSFKSLERETRNSFIQIKVKRGKNDIDFPVEYYTEEELETQLVCDSCGLEFAVYGIFSKCPDCKELNAFLVFNKSLEIVKNQLGIFSKPDIPNEIRELSLNNILRSAIAIFDALGKELRKRKPNLYPARPRNLFQNLSVLDEKLNNRISDQHSNFPDLLKYFQLRHVFEHNLGVIDDDFVKKVPQYKHFLGRKFKLETDELHSFLNMMDELGEIVKRDFEK
ncbi:MAG: hypothetical protein ABJG47_17445 [Ekhidna sp.]